MFAVDAHKAGAMRFQTAVEERNGGVVQLRALHFGLQPALAGDRQVLHTPFALVLRSSMDRTGAEAGREIVPRERLPPCDGRVSLQRAAAAHDYSFLPQERMAHCILRPLVY